MPSEGLESAPGTIYEGVCVSVLVLGCKTRR